MATYNFKNLVFEGGGVWGIGYLGMLQELDKRGILPAIEKVGGSSAGAITSLATSFNLDFAGIKALADTLDYSKIPETGEASNLVEKFALDVATKAINLALKPINSVFRKDIELSSGDLLCLLRLLNHYGWYSSDYFYGWLKGIIAQQFTVKQDSYTFRDFQDASKHKDKRPFKELYITGADISNKRAYIFSYQTTPDLEVAMAVRISMSIPLFFESLDYSVPAQEAYTNGTFTFADGGTMFNYPISLFDKKEFGGNDNTNYQTLGGHFFHAKGGTTGEVTHFKDYIKDLFGALMAGQTTAYLNTPEDITRTIDIDTFDVKATNFDIKTGDANYQKLFDSGVTATQAYLDKIAPK